MEYIFFDLLNFWLEMFFELVDLMVLDIVQVIDFFGFKIGDVNFMVSGQLWQDNFFELQVMDQNYLVG